MQTGKLLNSRKTKPWHCYDTLRQSDGSDHVVVYLRAEKQMKHLPASRSVEIEDNLLGILREKYGAENVKVVEKSIEKQLHMH